MTREEAIKVLNDYDINFEGHTPEEVAEAHEMAIKALKEQPKEECDCISRKTAIDALHRYFADGFDSDKWWNSTHVLDAINKVPSITPQPKTGHWIWCASSHKCSNCGEYVCFSFKKIPKYCPECGARMEANK